jgi:hypothetical protein
LSRIPNADCDGFIHYLTVLKVTYVFYVQLYIAYFIFSFLVVNLLL